MPKGAYIDGVYDERLESIGTHYNPVPSTTDFGKTLIDTFIKYVADHPEEEEMAASTVLGKAEKIIGNTRKPR